MAERTKLDPIFNLVFRLPPNEIGDAIKRLDVFMDENQNPSQVRAIS